MFMFFPFHMTVFPYLGWPIYFVTTVRSEQNGCQLTDVISKCIFWIEKLCILNQISPKFVVVGVSAKNPVSLLVMVWFWPDGKPLPEFVMTQLTDMCITKLQWVNGILLSHSADPSCEWDLFYPWLCCSWAARPRLGARLWYLQC